MRLRRKRFKPGGFIPANPAHVQLERGEQVIPLWLLPLYRLYLRRTLAQKEGSDD